MYGKGFGDLFSPFFSNFDFFVFKEAYICWADPAPISKLGLGPAF
jgi:hypothetical protein